MDYSRSPKAIALPTLDGATRRFRFPDSIEGVSHNGQHVLIIGGGVTGLTTAWVLLDAGYSVTIISERWAPATPPITSQIAGALWEYPPAVCGSHTDRISLAHSKQWALRSYRVFEELSKTEPSIKMRKANFFFGKPIEDIPGELPKMLEIQTSGVVKGFIRDTNLISSHSVNQEAGVVDSYAHLAPHIDTDAYMVWVLKHVVSKGVSLVTKRISGDLLDIEDQLASEYGAAAIVNATGLNAFELAQDTTCYPLRGALIRVVNDGQQFPRVTESLAVTHNDSVGNVDDIVFIVPRNDNILILGGIAQANRWETDLTLSSPEIQRMRSRCNNFVPGLENAAYDPLMPLVQGLRPFRGTNVRVERELRPNKASCNFSRIVHSYGHGGAGFSLSFGCAFDVLNLVREVERKLAPKRMYMPFEGCSAKL